MFFDLNIAYADGQSATRMLTELRELGYAGAAFTVEALPVGSKLPVDAIKRKVCPTDLREVQRTDVENFKDHSILKSRELCLNFHPKNVKEFIRLRRLHVEISHGNDLTQLNQFNKAQIATAPYAPNVFEIMSINVLDEKLFHTAVNTRDFDMLSFDLSAPRLPFPLKRKHIAHAVNRGFYFEFNLRGLIRDDGCSNQSRINFLRNARYLLRYLPPRAIICTSGALSHLGCRSATDLLPVFSGLLGIRESDARRLMSNNVFQLLGRSAARRSNGPGTVLPIGSMPLMLYSDRESDDDSEDHNTQVYGV